MNHDVRLLPLLPSGEPQLFARVLEDVARDVVLRALTGTDPQAYPALLDYPEAYSPPDPPVDPPPPDPTPDPVPEGGPWFANSKSAAIAKAILGTCRPCGCGSGVGSGSGSGSGGDGLPNCCGDQGPLASVTFSYDIPGCATCLSGCETGTGGSLDGGACDGFGSEYVFAGENITSQAGVATYFADCSSGGVTRNFQISLCCYTRNDSSSFFQVNAVLNWVSGADSIAYKWRAMVFDSASCSPFTADVTGLAAFETIATGSPCTCPALLTFSLTGSY